jgi:hypothetical protein
MTDAPAPPPQEKVWVALAVAAVLGVVIAGFVVALAPPSPCESSCATADDARELYPTEAGVTDLGFDYEVGYDGERDKPFNTWFVNTRREWNAGDGSPDRCMFMYTGAPSAARDPLERELDDPVVDFGGWTTDTEELITRVRVADGDDAVTGLHDGLRAGIEDCPEISIDHGIRDNYTATVSAARFELDDAVEHTAWHESSEYGDYTVIIMSAGNLVLRTDVWRGSDSELTDEAIAAFFTATSESLAILTS